MLRQAGSQLPILKQLLQHAAQRSPAALLNLQPTASYSDKAAAAPAEAKETKESKETPATPAAPAADPKAAAPQEPAVASASAAGEIQSVEEEDWTEVVHEKTGQIYYWNQRTGETTELGEPKPGPGGRRRQAGQDGEEEGTSQRIDPRAEPPLPDETGKYAAMGVFFGAFMGWACQFF